MEVYRAESSACRVLNLRTTPFSAKPKGKQMVTAAEPRSYEFGVFTVELSGGELRKHGVRLKLQERPFQLLVCLLEKPGEIISRDELRQRLWPDGTFVDFDHNISSAINKLRTVLNDSASNPRFIETVGSRGYRFLADVKRISSDPPSSQPAKQITAEVPKIEATTGSRHQGRWKVVAGTALMFSILVAGYFQWVRKIVKSVAPVTRVMVAVLPFQNLTGDPAQDYFSDGLTEEMIAELTRLNQGRLGVIARTSVMVYKQRPKPLDQIGRELGVQYLMEGSVRRDSGRVRITAELIQVKDQTHIWAREYDRELKNSLALQSEIAQEIGDEIQISLGDGNGVKAANHLLQPTPRLPMKPTIFISRAGTSGIRGRERASCKLRVISSRRSPRTQAMRVLTRAWPIPLD